MDTTLFLYLCAGLAGLILLIAGVWRLASRRSSLPCPTWLGWLLEPENPFFKAHSTREIILHMGLHAGMTVLDLGCGPGRLTIPIAERIGPQGEVTAMDIQPGMLRRVEEKARKANLSNIRFVQGGAGEGRLEHGKFDRALLVTVLGEIPNREAALKEVFDALKPGGMLSVTEVIMDPHFQSRGTVLRLVGNAGFREKGFLGNRFAFTLILEKPAAG